MASLRADCVVVGGGLAGLSAALSLTDSGRRVHLLEKRAVLGGRAYSYRAREAGHSVDNGQHLLMGCYEHTLAFVARTGARAAIDVRPRLEVPLIDGGGVIAWFRCARLPTPLHLTIGALRYRHLPVAARMRLLAVGLRFVRRHLLSRDFGGATVEQALRALGESEAARRCFWNPLAIAVLNERPERASAKLFGEVLRRVFLARASASRLIFPATGLTELFVTPAVRAIESAGGAVDAGVAVKDVVISGGRAVAVRLQGGRTIEARSVILALPPPALAEVLAEPLRTTAPFDGAARLRGSPIVSVHLWFESRFETPRMLGYLEHPIHWLFTPPMQPQQGRYVTLVSSGARELAALPPDRVVEYARDALRRAVPQSERLHCADTLVTKERFATWAATPEEQANRPSTTTPIPNLFLAGDWIDTGLPATIESAIVSGEMAAAAAARLV